MIQKNMKYVVTELGYGDCEELICNRYPYNHCECQKIFSYFLLLFKDVRVRTEPWSLQ